VEQLLKNPLFKKVLVIDDNVTDRYIAKRIIQKFNFCEELVLKESALKAIEYLLSLQNRSDQLPQFIFLDIRMPEMDGFEFLEEFAKFPESIKSNCIILMLSTSLNPNDHKIAEVNPFVYSFLTKPIEKSYLELLEKEFLVKKVC
jgi:CheY-like chemotaxis protein